MLTLCRYVGGRDGEPFEFGTADCLTFVAGAELVLGQADPIAIFRGRYNSAFSARRLMRAYGGLGGMLGAIAEEIDAGQASSGDWALVENWDGSESVGLVLGSTIWAKGRIGVTSCSRARAKQFYRPHKWLS